MSVLLNFIDTGFIITLGLVILISGSVMLYTYRRLNLLENSIIEHGKILQNFIINYNNQMIINNSNNIEKSNSETNGIILNEFNKINVLMMKMMKMMMMMKMMKMMKTDDDKRNILNLKMNLKVI